VITARPPSTQRTYDEFWSGDPAFEQAPENATEKQLAEHAKRIEACRDHAKWDSMLVEGGSPTKFVMAPVDRNIWREICDRGQLPASSERRIGDHMLAALLFRLALTKIENLDGVEVKRTRDAKWGWVMAQAEIVTILDEYNPGIVGELGSAVYERLIGPSPK
jgi:hypothetical protein